MTDKAVLDANVLVPIHLCDLLLRTAEADLFKPRWSDEILRETRLAIGRLMSSRGLDPSDFMPLIDRRIADMQRAFPDARVVGWEQLPPGIELPDPEDRHVVAAARRSGAAVIVTQNINDFPQKRLPHGIRATTADTFLYGSSSGVRMTLSSAFTNRHGLLGSTARQCLMLTPSSPGSP